VEVATSEYDSTDMLLVRSTARVGEIQHYFPANFMGGNFVEPNSQSWKKLHKKTNLGRK